MRLPQARPQLEALETRLVPYSVTGNAWPSPQLITISFVPDGTVLAGSANGNLTSNMFSVFNKKFGSTATWENQILKAAQTWAAKTNINFAVVSDDGSETGSGAYQQGASNFGDIRIGAYGFLNTWVAASFYPPPVNNYSLAGDIDFNTNDGFNIGTTYDLYTVAMHEFGHALGLADSSVSKAVMTAVYPGVLTGLNADDVSGIQAIYGTGRTADSYSQAGSNASFATASNISSTIDPNLLTADLSSLNIISTSDKHYFTFTAPANSASTMSVTVQSSGLSLLDPTVTVFDGNQNQLGTASNTSSETGATLTVTVNNVIAGNTYYVEVSPAVSTVFGSGAYALTLNLGTGPNPTVPIPNTQLANGNPLQAGGGQAELPIPDTTSQTNLAATNGSLASANARLQQNADAPTVNTLVVPANTPLMIGAESAAASAAVVGTVGSSAVIRFDSAHTTVAVSRVPLAEMVAEPDATENQPPALTQPPMVVPAADEMIVPDQPQRSVPGPVMAQAAIQGPHVTVADHDACFSDEVSTVNLPLSVEKLADATSSDWDSTAALAAVSALLAGTWSQWEKKKERKPLQAKRVS